MHISVYGPETRAGRSKVLAYGCLLVETAGLNSASGMCFIVFIVLWCQVDFSASMGFYRMQSYVVCDLETPKNCTP